MNWLVIAVFILLALCLVVSFRILQNLFKAGIYTFLLFVLLLLLGVFYSSLRFQIGEQEIIVLHSQKNVITEGFTLSPTAPEFTNLFPDFSKGKDLDESTVEQIADLEPSKLLEQYHQVLVFHDLPRTDLSLGSDLELMRDTQRLFLLRQFKEGTLKIYPQTFSQKVVDALPSFILKRTLFRSELS